MNYTVYLRNNWSADWTKIEQAKVEWGGTEESFSDKCTVTVQMTAARLSEIVTTNIYRMYSELRVDETDHDGTTFTRYHGFVINVTPAIENITLECLDFLGLCTMLRCEVPASSADIIRIGTDASPVTMHLEVEDGENRYIPDPATYPTAYTGGVPEVPPTNRRTWKAVAGVRDSGTQDTDPEAADYYPDHLLPPSLWQMGSDLLNYLQFIGWTPLGTITVDFLVMYVEDTNQIEDIILGAVAVALPHGPELVAGVHYNAVSADYFTKTIWPSLITVNEWKWTEADGTLADMIDKLLSGHAPPNYKVWWDHEKMMLRCQYVELLPFDTTTSYYVAGSYAYGRVVTAPPTVEAAGDYVDYSEVDPGRTVARDTDYFKSKIIIGGTNEWPANVIEESMITSLESLWPSGFATDGALANLIDRDMGTSFKIWNESQSSSPAPDVTNRYYPMLHIYFGEETSLERLRFWMLDSRRDFPFFFRVEAHNDPAYTTYDVDAPWEPMHTQLWDRQAKPFELVDVGGSFLRSICRCVLISMKPTKVHLKYTFAGGLSDLEFIRTSKVSGRASVIGATPGVGWTLIRGTSGVTGSWYQKIGVKETDGEVAVLLPLLYNQLCSRSAIANKLVAGHRADYKTNNSLANTNQCAFEAARILMETLREARKFNFTGKSIKAAQKYRTASFEDALFGVTRKALVESISSQQPGVVDIAGTAYGYSDSHRGGTWTDEVPVAL